MRVVIDATSTRSNSNRVYIRNLLRAFCALETDNEYLVLTASDYAAEWLRELESRWPNCRVVGLPVSGALLRLVFQQLVMPWILLWWRADVLYSIAHTTTLMAFCPTVTLIHDLNIFVDRQSEEVESLSRRLRRFCLRWLSSTSAQRSRRVIFVSDFSRNYIAARVSINLSKTRVINHGVELERFRGTDDDEGQGSGLFDTDKIILSVSTLNRHKNFETLISAFATLPEELRDQYTLVIAGRPSDKAYEIELYKLAEAFGLKGKIHFLGEVPHQQIHTLYRRAEIFVFPSRLEVFGIPLIEAMGAGVPVIASKAAAIPEIVGHAGILFDENDSADLARILEELLRDPVQRAILRSKGYQRAAQFSWSHCARETLAVLREAVEARTLKGE